VLEKALKDKEDEISPKKSFGFKTKFVRGEPAPQSKSTLQAAKKDVVPDPVCNFSHDYRYV